MKFEALAEIVSYDSAAFYTQAWWRDQSFASQRHPAILTMPTAVQRMYPNESGALPLPYASQLAALYLAHRDSEIWRSFLWTADLDDDGNRVYVGGVGIYGIPTFQIHRHLTIDDRWGTAVWAL